MGIPYPRLRWRGTASGYEHARGRGGDGDPCHDCGPALSDSHAHASANRSPGCDHASGYGNPHPDPGYEGGHDSHGGQASAAGDR